MGTHLHPLERNTDLARVTDYYVSRMQQLAQLARCFGARAAFIESEALIERTDETLEFLRQHLELSKPLQRRYRRFSKTGKPGFGDPSPVIHRGEIGTRVRRPRIQIPADLLKAVTKAHQACLEACRRHAVTMPVSTCAELSGVV
jgi:hypothetical protein